jgi:hypothetical protein
MRLLPFDRWDKDTVDQDLDIEVVEGEIIEETRSGIQSYPSALSLDEVIRAYGSFPAYSVIFGICEDGLPLTLNLKEPAAGSLLIEAEARRGKTQVIRTVLTSAAILNRADRVNFCVISPYPDELADLFNFPHCQGLVAPYERLASEIILELSAQAEQRRFGRERGPAYILAIDDLGALVGEHLDYDVLLHLRWLISKGPASEIWTIASLPSHAVPTCDPQIITQFRTRIASGKLFQKTNLQERNGNFITSPGMMADYGFITRVKQQQIHFLPLSTR